MNQAQTTTPLDLFEAAFAELCHARKRMAGDYNPHDIRRVEQAEDSVSRLIAQHGTALLSLARRASSAEKALESIVRSEPCVLPCGRCGYPQFDQEGEEIGFQDVDPCGIVGEMVGIARAALEEKR